MILGACEGQAYRLGDASGGSGSTPTEAVGGSSAAGGTNATGTCPFRHPTQPTYYPGDPRSPCPAQEPAGLSCDSSQVGFQCIYPSSRSEDLQVVYQCTNAIPGPGSWDKGEYFCHRTGENCLVSGPVEEAGLPGPTVEVELTTACDQRTLVSCHDEPGTVQRNLDVTLVYDVVLGCLPELHPSQTSLTLTLTVYFDGDCPKRFLVYPAEATECVQRALETVRFDCAAGLVCGATASFSDQ